MKSTWSKKNMANQSLREQLSDKIEQIPEHCLQDIMDFIGHILNRQPPDLSTIELKEIVLEDRILRFRSPLILTPESNETKQLLCIKKPYLGIDVCAETHDELYELLLQEIEVLWFEYALERDDRLNSGALELKHRLSKHIDEELNAEG
jgi:hypothetical protein